MGLNPVKAKILSGFFSATAKIAGYLKRFFPGLRDQLDCHQRLSVSDHWVSYSVSGITNYLPDSCGHLMVHLRDDKIKMDGLTFQDSKLIGSTTVG